MMKITTNSNSSPQQYKLVDLVLYFVKLGSLGFGGPVALVGYMQRDLVEKKKWITEDDYKEGLALAQLAPGPLAAQLGIYMGYVHYGILGATLTGLAFILPSFLMVAALGYAYTLYNGLPWMQAVFYGVGAAVIGIIAKSSYKLTLKTVANSWLLWSIFLLLAIITFITEQESILLILASGFVVLFVKHPVSKWKKQANFTLLPLLGQIATVATSSSQFSNLFWFFAKAGAFVFGSGLAIVPFLYGGVVNEYQWLSEQQFVDAVAVAMISPGPIVITVGFIGYLVGGLPGACVAAVATFLPCYLLTIIPAPYFKKYGKQPTIKAFVDGVTTAAVGAIAGAVLVISQRTLQDIPTVLIALTTLVALFKFKKLQEPVVILIAAGLGLVIMLL
jgi:chromate transporter